MNDQDNTITIPLGETAPTIRESVRAVLRAHMFAVAREQQRHANEPALELVALDVARFEALLVELGNNAAQNLVALHENVRMDTAEEKRTLKRASDMLDRFSQLIDNVRDYLDALDEFEAKNYSDPGFRRSGARLAELQAVLRVAVRQ